MKPNEITKKIDKIDRELLVLLQERMGLSLRSKKFQESSGESESEEDMLDLIQEQDDHIDCLMLFGHNPGMTYLVNDLSNLDLDNLPTCGVVVLKFDVYSWSEVGETEADRADLDSPKMHR